MSVGSAPPQAIFTKHHGFNEENEWRMVYMKDRDTDKATEGPDASAELLIAWVGFTLGHYRPKQDFGPSDQDSDYLIVGSFSPKR
jgi:hypothetical protein